MPNAKTWVDFKHVREAVDFGEILEAYGVTLKLRGEEQHQGFCPLPGHDGQKRSPSFSAHLGKKAFHCFGCQAKGNVIDFVALMEGMNPDDRQDIRQAALLIQERFLQEEAKPARSNLGRSPPRGSSQPQRRYRYRHRPERPTRNAASKPDPTPETASPVPPKGPEPDTRPRILNAPLEFKLKGLDSTHPYLAERGLTPETIETFGLGYCGRGLMAGRIAIPLRNGEGELIGYAGRIVDDHLIDAENPKYRLPGKREKDGTVFEFSSGAFLFNGDRLKATCEELIVVEGFFSVFHLHQLGWTNVVALMGSSVSEAQATLICRHTHFDAQIWIMPDGDAAGITCAKSLLAELAPERSVRWAQLDPGEQPHTCSEERLHDLLDLPHWQIEALYS